ncbi:MAG: DMT family transporter [Prevotella sp.]|jgi:drug/metabolite transporter (DMT)-like permease|nr:DMT family transporter [Prevotella sp.]
MNARVGYHLVAFVTVAIWGSTFVFTKLLLLNGLSPAQIFTLRFLIAYVLLLAFSLLKGDERRSLVLSRQRSGGSWKSLLKRELLMLSLGVTGGSVYFLTENEALNYTTTTNVSLIVCSCPLVAAVLIGLFYKSERLRPVQIVGTLMAVLGVSAVVLNGHFVLHLSPVGDALALGANLCWAIYSLLMIPANKHYGALFITRKVFLYGLLTMIPYYILVPAELPVQLGGTLDLAILLDPQVLTHLLFLGVVASCICFLVWTWVMDKLGAMIATNYVYVNPLSTIVVASLVLNEQITVYFLLGALLIVGGMYLADRK